MAYRTIEEYCSNEAAMAVASINGNAFDRVSDLFLNANSGQNESIDFDTFCSWHTDTESMTNAFLRSKGLSEIIVRPLINDAIWWLTKKHHIILEVSTKLSENGYDIIYIYRVHYDSRFGESNKLCSGKSNSLCGALDAAVLDGCKLVKEVECK